MQAQVIHNSGAKLDKQHESPMVSLGGIRVPRAVDDEPAEKIQVPLRAHNDPGSDLCHNLLCHSCPLTVAAGHCRHDDAEEQEGLFLQQASCCVVEL